VTPGCRLGCEHTGCGSLESLGSLGFLGCRAGVRAHGVQVGMRVSGMKVPGAQVGVQGWGVSTWGEGRDVGPWGVGPWGAGQGTGLGCEHMGCRWG